MSGVEHAGDCCSGPWALEAEVDQPGPLRRRCGSQNQAQRSSASTRFVSGDLLAPGRRRTRFSRTAGQMRRPLQRYVLIGKRVRVRMTVALRSLGSTIVEMGSSYGEARAEGAASGLYVE